MKHIIFTLLFILWSVTTVFAAPSESDRQKALELMYTLTSDQELHFELYSSYESVAPKNNDGFITYSCAYSTANGKGYVTSIVKVENSQAWRIQRHFGPESLSVNGSWTCISCNGGKFSFPKPNEHGLCDIEGVL